MTCTGQSNDTILVKDKDQKTTVVKDVAVPSDNNIKKRS